MQNEFASYLGRDLADGSKHCRPPVDPVDATLNREEAERFAMLMRELGYKGRVVERAGGAWVESSTSGNNFIIYMHETGEINAIRFDGFVGPIAGASTAALLRICDDFNGQGGLGRVALSQAGDNVGLALLLDHYCPNGIASESFVALAKYFVGLIEKLTGILKDVRFGQEALSCFYRTVIEIMARPDAKWHGAAARLAENAGPGHEPSLTGLGKIYASSTDPFETKVPAAYFLARAACNLEPEACYLLAKVLLDSAPEDLVVIAEATQLAVLAATHCAPGEARAVAEKFRDRLLAMFEESEREQLKSLAERWPI